MSSQTVAKTDGSVVVLAFFLCFVGWGTQRRFLVFCEVGIRKGPTGSNVSKGRLERVQRRIRTGPAKAT